MGSILRVLLPGAIYSSSDFQTEMTDLAALTQFAQLLEGPYRWYILGFIVVILTALVTKFIFKTIKWFLVLAALVLIALAIVKLLIKILP